MKLPCCSLARWSATGVAALAAGLGMVALSSSQAADKEMAELPAVPEGMAEATFAGGCFWCTESTFDKLPGVASTTSGYLGGFIANPTYEAVCSGNTGHAEAVRVVYDPKRISYEKLLDAYWHSIDPFDPYGQFADKGTQYRTVIYTHSPEQKKAAEESVGRVREELSGRFPGKKIAVKIEEATTFYPAEEYHQDYSKENSFRYERYRMGCGRVPRLKEIWGDKASR